MEMVDAGRRDLCLEALVAARCKTRSWRRALIGRLGPWHLSCSVAHGGCTPQWLRSVCSFPIVYPDIHRARAPRPLNTLPRARAPSSSNMPPKTVEEQLAELEMEAEAPAAPPPKSSKPAKAPRKTAQQDIDALKELEELEALEKFQAPEAPRPSSRSNTPKLPSSTASSKRAGAATPSSSGSGRTSEEKTQPPRKSGESARSFHQGFAPTEEEPVKPAPVPQQQSGGWGWGGFSVGGLLSTASATADAARKRAEAAYQDLQKNEEAQRWAEQVRGVRGNVNLGALRGLGMLVTTNYSLRETDNVKERNCRNAPSRHSQTSSTPSPRPSPNTSAFKSTLPTISPATLRLTP